MRSTALGVQQALARYVDGPPSPRRELDLMLGLGTAFVVGIVIALLGRRYR